MTDERGFEPLTEVAFWRPAACPGLELRRARYRRHTFERHLHGVWSLGLVLEGETRFSLHGRDWQAGVGDLVLIPPGEVHDCNPYGETPLGYWMFYIETPPVLPAGPWHTLAAVWSAAPAFADWIALAHAWRDSAEAPSPAEPSGLRQHWWTAWAALLAAWPRDLSARGPGGDEPWLQQVADRLASELSRPLSLAELSAEVGISASHLNRRFAASYGLPPHRYQLQCRLDVAKRLLRSGLLISAVAHELGFSDQSHFTRWFRRCVGATPARYQQGH